MSDLKKYAKQWLIDNCNDGEDRSETGGGDTHTFSSQTLHELIDEICEDYEEQRADGWISLSVQMPKIGQYVQLFSGGVVQNVNPMLDGCDDGYFWHFHGLLDEDPYIKDGDMWQPLPLTPPTNQA